MNTTDTPQPSTEIVPTTAPWDRPMSVIREDGRKEPVETIADLVDTAHLELAAG
ncbi:hypothetical protein [Streptomyces sp. NPDC005407]|uniref:hypothetical protein n=1 Tax=Streptomyces sp. NPDC005407 TaxID=3155340 RepID=UPI0033A773BB